jgi:hypothetical protein
MSACQSTKQQKGASISHHIQLHQHGLAQRINLPNAQKNNNMTAAIELEQIR